MDDAETKAERRLRIERERQRTTRRKRGVKPRAEYLAAVTKNSAQSTKPWEAEGVSRSTYYRDRRAERLAVASRAAYLKRQAGEYVAPLTMKRQTWSDGRVISEWIH
jgi:hypothetical protein